MSKTDRESVRWLAAALCLAALIAIPAVAAPNSADHLQRSVQLLQQGDLQSAEETLQPALEDPATRPVAYALLGSIRLQQKKYQEGTQLLERAIKADSQLVGAHLSLAQAYAFLGKADRAETLFRRVLELAPDNQNARLALVQAASKKGDHRQALDLARPVEKQLRSSPDGLLLLAEALTGVGDRKGAQSLVPDWLRLRGVPAAWIMKFAVALSDGGLTDEPIKILEQAKSQGIASYELAFNLAGFYVLKGDPARASENYEWALTFNDRSLPALRQTARIAEKQGELEKALSFLIRAKLEAPDDPDVLFAFGTVSLRLEFIEDATGALEKAARLRPDHKPTRYWLATARGAARQFDEALALYKALLDEDPEDPQLNYAVGSVFYLQVAFDKAEKYLKESIRLNPEQLLLPFYLAMSAQKQGHADEAMRMFREILETHPDHAPSYEGLGRSLFKQRQYEEARTQFEKAIELDPKSPAANYQLGQLLVRMGLREEAKERLALAKGLREEEEKTQLVRTLLNPH